MSPSPRLRVARWMTGVFMVGLVLSGLTAMPVLTQLHAVTHFVSREGSAFGEWIWRVLDAAEAMHRDAPFMFYGYDWLAFGHIAIALAFVPAWRQPLNHRWLFDYGLTLCGLVIVWAVCVGPFRGIPWGWTLVDCSFGVLGAVPLIIAKRVVAAVERQGPST
ncbi:MAG: hypothetical protein QM754_10865 [Tepidisphaeraceae bacterium]